MNNEYIRKQDAVELCNNPLSEQSMRLVPPADVAPVIHSEWEYHMSFGICHNCGYEYDWKATDARNYCPMCGAKMDRERKE